MNRIVRLVALTCFALAAASSANAIPLPPGGAVSGPALAGLGVGGGSQVASMSDRIEFSGMFMGAYTSAVIDGDSNNPLGGLTFLYQFANDESSSVDIRFFVIAGLPRRMLEVSYEVDQDFIAPSMVERLPTGAAILFDFSTIQSNPDAGFVAPGSSSTILLVRTAMTEYSIGEGVLYSDVSGSGVYVPAFVPIPEPSSKALLTLGGVGIGTRRRLRRQYRRSGTVIARFDARRGTI